MLFKILCYRSEEKDQICNKREATKHELVDEAKESCNPDPLLQTIKYNPKDLKGLKNRLPKANYIQE